MSSNLSPAKKQLNKTKHTKDKLPHIISRRWSWYCICLNDLKHPPQIEFMWWMIFIYDIAPQDTAHTETHVLKFHSNFHKVWVACNVMLNFTLWSLYMHNMHFYINQKDRAAHSECETYCSHGSIGQLWNDHNKAKHDKIAYIYRLNVSHIIVYLMCIHKGKYWKRY